MSFKIARYTHTSSVALLGGTYQRHTKGVQTAHATTPANATPLTTTDVAATPPADHFPAPPLSSAMKCCTKLTRKWYMPASGACRSTQAGCDACW